MRDRDALLADLDVARDAFHEVLAQVDAELATVPGVMEDWSVRDIVYHLAVWCEHGSEALTLAVAGRGDEFAYSTSDTDAMNERFLTDGRAVSPASALRREESAFADFRDRIAGLDPSLVGTRLGNGDTVEAVIVYDGPEHYDEHVEHLRGWFGADAEDDD
jgi:Mycothiol maleylpyruvate isomerase N-terminal domain